ARPFGGQPSSQYSAISFGYLSALAIGTAGTTEATSTAAIPVATAARLLASKGTRTRHLLASGPARSAKCIHGRARPANVFSPPQYPAIAPVQNSANRAGSM